MACVPRSLTYLNRLLIYNGVDKVFMWDGTTLREVIEFVKETATAFTRIDDTHVSFTAGNAFNSTKYQNNNLIQIKINGVMALQTFFEVVNVTEQDRTVTLTTKDILPQFVPDETHLFYRDWIPRFSFMAVAHDRIWALGEGAVGLNYRNPDQAKPCGCTFLTNRLLRWIGLIPGPKRSPVWTCPIKKINPIT